MNSEAAILAQKLRDYLNTNTRSKWMSIGNTEFESPFVTSGSGGPTGEQHMVEFKDDYAVKNSIPLQMFMELNEIADTDLG